ncbi:MAG TPA: hypothetical protein VE869_12860 [Gemmatimonas sp.]|nr:hypothetical protein [Gemmatimonas sp.]
MHHSTLPRGARALLVALVSSAALSASAGAQTAVQADAGLSGPAAAALFAAPAAVTSTARTSGIPASRSMLLESNAVGLTLAARDSVSSKVPAPLPRQQSSANRTNTALIIVGVAAIVLGAIVEDDAGTVLIIGGAGIGLYGLYRLLN